jgi:hypothetical protein
MLRSRKGRPSRHINSLASGGAPISASMPRVSTESGLEPQQQQQQQQRNASFCFQQKSVSGEFDLALRRHSALARGSSWQFQQQRKMGAASMLTQREEEELLSLHRQTSVGPGMRGIKGFGGHMADVMQVSGVIIDMTAALPCFDVCASWQVSGSKPHYMLDCCSPLAFV